ncbi:hypothetical protein EYZ11_003832 [Aspergillus tanneri]|uniref:Cell wall mannoprotein 1 n=1 Tax=Aspergillus tanneri TaxID=1220188 RepID=A0A4S3JPC5_9EURO|nr:uncharacterized protein ATNIH1004_002930 [Aspergillus tanneri]KAA8650248.1 hypothetical protein ATNIH1004_002930 [Aspergillus tanneri]THC96677.1 hypothetical protein EYZ11_003832 [Aspergillus tanneri]
MRFTALFTLGLATSALATPAVVQRDSTGVTNVLSEVGKGVDALGSAADGYNGGDPSKVESASEDLIATIKKGVSTVEGGGDLTSSDALALTSPVKDLTSKVQDTVDKIIAKKSKFEAAGAATKVKESLNAQYKAADSLSSAISKKVPEALSDLAKELSAGITKAIQKGIDAYKDAKDSNPGKETATATKTGDSEPTGGAGKTTSTPTIPKPTSSGPGSSSATPSPTGGSGSGGSGSGSQPPLHTGAANINRFSYTLGGAVAAAAVAVAF